MKKRLLMIIAVAFLLVGCGNQQETNSTPTEAPTSTEAPTPTPTPTETPTPPPTETPTPTPTETPTPTPTEPPHEHAYTEAITTEATCTEAGEKTFTCDCGDTYTEQIEATGHNYEAVADSEVSATCTNDGKEADTKCSLCDDVISGAVIPALSHSYGDYVYNNDATTKKDGTETATCSACGDKSTVSKEGTKLLYDGYDEFGNGFVYGSKTEYDKMGNKVKQKIFEANNPYTLYQVVDYGDTNIYFYFMDTGSANKGPEYNACYDAGIAILFGRYPEKTVQMAQGEYVGTYNGQVIYKALPITGSMGPDGRPVW